MLIKLLLFFLLTLTVWTGDTMAKGNEGGTVVSSNVEQAAPKDDSILKAEVIIRKYVTDEKTWGKDGYYIEEKSRDSENHTVTFAVVHRDDIRTPSLRSQKSITVLFDMDAMKIKQVLHSQ